MPATDFPHIYGPNGEGRHHMPVPFGGAVPDVGPGDRVLARDMNGDWHPKVAVSTPRYDHACALGRRAYWQPC